METLGLSFFYAIISSLILTLPGIKITNRWNQISIIRDENIDFSDKNINALTYSFNTILIGGSFSIILLLLNSSIGIVFLLGTFALYSSFHLLFWLETGVEIINPRLLLAITIGLWGTLLSTTIVVIFK